MRELLLKMAGGEQSPPRAKAGEIFSAWVGSCLAIACIALLERYATGNSGFPLLIGSFGASAVLAFGAIRSPLAQPRNLVGGHFLSALVGVSCYFLFPGTPWLASCLAVATAIALMHVTKPCTLREAPRRSSRSRAGRASTSTAICTPSCRACSGR